MRIYKALKDIAKKIMPNATEKRIEPPDTYHGGEAYGVDTLAIQYIQQSAGRGIEQMNISAVIMCYIESVMDIDEWLTNVLEQLGYPDIQDILDTYNEIVAITIDKIVVYSLNAFGKRAVAIHLSIVSNL